MPTYPLRSKARFTCDRSCCRHERLLVDQQRRDQRDAGEIDRTERHAARPSAAMQMTVADVHHARDPQRPRDAEAHRDRVQAVRAIEVEVLAGIENVEAADPQPDRQAEQPRLRRADRGRRPPASRRPAPPPSPARERPACRTCSAWPANTRTRSPARPATAGRTAGSAATTANTKIDRRDDHEDASRRGGSSRRAESRASPCAG